MKKRKTDTFTWADLKVFVNQLNDKQLSGEVIWWGEERGGKMCSAECLKEDYGNPSGDGLEPRSAYSHDKDLRGGKFPVSMKVGTPVFLTE